ncbi:hypothetical protein D8L93_08415 [Sodalis-like symbiont of Bactericera trigonica]|nr:hypothetical protein D8L93_08415 [Sodalis-like symbiont of Bactericera trigonica]
MMLIIALTFTLICGPIGGWLADRYGSAKIFICGALFALFFVYPLFYLVDTKKTALAALGVSAIYGISWGCAPEAHKAHFSLIYFPPVIGSPALPRVENSPAPLSAGQRLLKRSASPRLWWR